jgi:hypothetical protein
MPNTEEIATMRVTLLKSQGICGRILLNQLMDVNGSFHADMTPEAIVAECHLSLVAPLWFRLRANWWRFQVVATGIATVLPDAVGANPASEEHPNVSALPGTGNRHQQPDCRSRYIWGAAFSQTPVRHSLAQPGAYPDLPVGLHAGGGSWNGDSDRIRNCGDSATSPALLDTKA